MPVDLDPDPDLGVIPPHLPAHVQEVIVWDMTTNKRYTFFCDRFAGVSEGGVGVGGGVKGGNDRWGREGAIAGETGGGCG